MDGGADNRVVTITGSPANAQTAHMLINQRLQVQYVLYVLNFYKSTLLLLGSLLLLLSLASN